MNLPSISIINFSSELKDKDIQTAIRAVNRQVMDDFMPIWGSGYLLRLHEASFDPLQSDSLKEEPVRGEGVIYLVDEASLPGALGFHDLNAGETPFGFVFILDPNDWTVTLSHEVLELIIDPIAFIFVPGPDPRDPTNLDKFVWHTYEVCDAVEETSYKIDGVEVSNFVTPSYFGYGDALGTRNDFLGEGVTSFGRIPPSHIAFYDPATGFDTVSGRADIAEAPRAKRTGLYNHAKPKRPADDRLHDILNQYHKEPHPMCQGLPHVRGITRTARYQAASQRLSSGATPSTGATQKVPAQQG